MNINDLENEANKFLEEFNLELDIPIIINNRLRSTLGVFYHNKNKALRIELSKILIEIGHIEVVIDTLRHECLHYALFVLNKPFNDKDEYFISEAKRLNVGLTEQCYVGVEYELQCVKCGKKAITEIKNHLVKKYNGTKYKIQCCKGEYIHTKTIISDGVEEFIK